MSHHDSSDEIEFTAQDVLMASTEVREVFSDTLDQLTALKLPQITVRETIDIDDVIDGYAESGADKVEIKRTLAIDFTAPEADQCTEEIEIWVTSRSDAENEELMPWDKRNWCLAFSPIDKEGEVTTKTSDWLPSLMTDLHGPVGDILRFTSNAAQSSRYTGRSPLGDKGEILYDETFDQFRTLVAPFMQIHAKKVEWQIWEFKQEDTTIKVHTTSAQNGLEDPVHERNLIDISDGTRNWQYIHSPLTGTPETISFYEADGKEVEQPELDPEKMIETHRAMIEEQQALQRAGVYDPTEGKYRSLIGYIQKFLGTSDAKS